MSAPTTSFAFSGSTPAAPAGSQVAQPQSDNGTPQQILDFTVPNTGGVSVKTADYTLAAADCGKQVVLDSASAHTFTLPATPPSVGANQWTVAISNVGAGILTLAVTGPALLDKGSASVTLATKTGLTISTDGTNYFSEPGAVSSASPTGAAGGDLSGTYPNPTVVTTHLSAPLPVAQGGTGTASPGIVAGTNVTVTGSFPNQTVAAPSVALPSGAGVVYSGVQNPAGGSPLLPTVVQSKAAANRGTSVSFTSNVTAGNLLVAVFADQVTSLTSATLSDNRSTSYSTAYTQNGPGTSLKMFYGIAGSSGACTLTIAGYTVGTWENWAIYEISNAQAALDGTATGSGTDSPGSLTTTLDRSIAIVGLAGDHNDTTWTAPAGWAIVQQNGQNAVGIASLVVSPASAVAPTFTSFDGGGENTAIAAFKAVNSTAFSGGSDGDYYVRTDTNELFGPKASGVWPSTSVPVKTAFSSVTGIASVAQGGTGTSAPSLAGGPGIAVTGSWPNQTVATVGGGASGSLVLLEEHSAGNSASLNFTTRNAAGQSGNTFQSDFDVYKIFIVEWVPVTHTASIASIRYSTNGGSTWDSSTIYTTSSVQFYAGAGYSQLTGQTSHGLHTQDNAIGSAPWCLVAELTLYMPQSTTYNKRIMGMVSNYDGATFVQTNVNLAYISTSVVNAIQFFQTSGNVSTGTVRIYGVAK